MFIPVWLVFSPGGIGILNQILLLLFVFYLRGVLIYSARLFQFILFVQVLATTWTLLDLFLNFGYWAMFMMMMDDFYELFWVILRIYYLFRALSALRRNLGFHSDSECRAL